nr:dehydrogenase/reductase sdr family member 4 [Quercus suber]
MQYQSYDHLRASLCCISAVAHRLTPNFRNISMIYHTYISLLGRIKDSGVLAVIPLIARVRAPIAPHRCILTPAAERSVWDALIRLALLVMSWIRIGFGVAESLIEHGATVTISSSNSSRVQSTVDALKKAYPSASSRIFGYACNLGDASAVEDDIKQLFEKTGKVDHVVYTAGDALAMLPIQDLTMEKIQQAGQIRFFSPMLVAKHAVNYMTSSNRSSFTITSGAVAERPMPGWALINAYATGLQGLVRGLALDLKPIRVNLVQPGYVDTALWATIGMSEEAKLSHFKEAEATLPTGKVAMPEDVAEAYLYCIKDNNVTGEIINTNGGSTLV